MRIISRKSLTDFWKKRGCKDAEQPLKSWYKIALEADWKSPSDVKQCFRNASIVGNNRVVFNIAGNKYRLVCAVNYSYRVLYIRFVGNHSEYDEIDVSII